jgi:7-cyano-7-deazaguanine reductase
MDNPLGKKVGLPTSYDPSVLFSIYRSEQRGQLDGFKYSGYDAWNIHELLWLDHDNNVHHDEICIKIDANSVAIPESKSMKLFLGSLVHETFSNKAAVHQEITMQINKLTESDITIDNALFNLPNSRSVPVIKSEEGLLAANESKGPEGEMIFNGFRSLCPVTDQPDIANIYITGRLSDDAVDKIQRYLGSFFSVNSFHEACVEKIFFNLIKNKYLVESVAGHFERRGGISIIPVRF